jgi:hypothetical protein
MLCFAVRILVDYRPASGNGPVSASTQTSCAVAHAPVGPGSRGRGGHLHVVLEGRPIVARRRASARTAGGSARARPAAHLVLESSGLATSGMAQPARPTWCTRPRPSRSRPQGRLRPDHPRPALPAAPRAHDGRDAEDFPALVHRHAARAPAIIVSSAYTAADVERTLGVTAARVHLCPPGPPPWAEAVRRERTSRSPAHILFVGTLEPRKNIGVLLDAYEQLRARRPGAPPLVLAGGIPPTAAQWRERAEPPPLADRVPARLCHRRAPRAVRRSAHWCCPPRTRVPTADPRGLACVPVVISSGGSLPEVAGDAATRSMRPTWMALPMPWPGCLIRRSRARPPRLAGPCGLVR